MHDQDYRTLLQRAEQARTIPELRQIVADAKQAYPSDPLVELLDQTCFMYATGLIERAADDRRARREQRGQRGGPYVGEGGRDRQVLTAD